MIEIKEIDFSPINVGVKNVKSQRIDARLKLYCTMHSQYFEEFISPELIKEDGSAWVRCPKCDHYERVSHQKLKLAIIK